MDTNHHEHPELWFRPSPAMPLSVLLPFIENGEITTTYRLGKRDGAHPKGYIPGRVATLRLFDDKGKEQICRAVRIVSVTSTPLNASPDWQSVQEDLSFFEGRPIAPEETISFVKFSYLNGTQQEEV